VGFVKLGFLTAAKLAPALVSGLKNTGTEIIAGAQRTAHNFFYMNETDRQQTNVS
jgi:hypothetical protein